ncbi:unnamed protein product [Arctia plantaginis]|uniref:Reverse transcriptase n=1 Tax=Arctia plantaginis TaxID=874455 RepID=A0A8S1AZQ2_ARCPL|nr:unnamed protein product [Arctia plantaginis]
MVGKEYSAAKDEVQGVQRLKEVLSVASEYGLEINWKKANLICSEIEYLGHRIQNGEISPSLEKTDAVMRYPEPRTTKQKKINVMLLTF